jgi:site-specific DNA-methyltransferase (adenine-specific)
MFPQELPRRLIRMFSFVGDTVLDPFLGSGTTCLAAMNLKRNSVGYEINEEYIPIIKRKLGSVDDTLFPKSEISLTKQAPLAIAFKHLIEHLPYKYSDSKKINKKVDPRQLIFGSTISGRESKTQEFYRLKRVVDANTIELTTGALIRLLGISPLVSKKEDAISFLSNILSGQNIMLKFDETKYDKENYLLAYVYLSNKTFVNARMIRMGLAVPEKKYNYKYKAKFVGYSN